MSFKSSQGFQRVSYRLVIAFAFCAVAPAAHAKTDGAGLSSPIAGVSESQKVTIRLSEHQVRLLINSSGEQRELRLRQIAGQKAISLNRELERSIFNEAVLSAMLRSLLDESVEQAAFAQALANQAKFYGKLSDQLTELMEAAEEWRGPLQEAINTIEAGRFEDADLELAEIARALEETQVVVSSRQRSRQLGAAGIAATRAHLAVVRSHLAEASRLYEDAFSLYSDEAALVPAEWLVLGAQTAASHGDQARALEYLELANALAVRQIQSGTPFPEWLRQR